jgi:sigma-54 dependent transcriptional regulator, acetoin dehydrogenase operon transcriptional activator AcoR
MRAPSDRASLRSTGKPEPTRPIASSLGLPSAHVAAIDDSHDRCAALGLSRFETPDLSPLARSDMAIVRERNARLFEHAAPVMELLLEQIEPTQSMVLLCDALGTVLHSVGDDDFLARASQVALAPGANWSEQSKGTNAVGTALVREVPTLVHADEHFFDANHFLTCSAAPILDPKGRVLGVLDVSGDHHGYHQHTMALVKMSARMIENHWLSDDYRHVMRLHFHHRPEFIGTLNEGILAVTSDGRVVGVNRSALDLLGLSGAAARMQSIEQLIGLRVGALVDHFRSPLATPLAVRTNQGHPLYLLARFDWPVWHTLADAVQQATNLAPSKSTGKAAPDGARQATRASTQPTTIVDHARPNPMVPNPITPFQGLTGLDARVAELACKAQRVHDRGLPVLVVGEAGSDKPSLARALHDASMHADGPFVVVRLAALNALQQDLALFGTVAQPGSVMQAQGGTLCVADVDALHPSVQIKLERLLHDGHAVVADAAQAQPVQLALVATTQHDLRERVAQGQWSQDLHQLLNGLTIKWPSLRERSDVLALAQAMLQQIAPTATPSLSAAAGALIQRAAWPGNQRQLRRLLTTACALAQGAASIEVAHLPDDFVELLRAPTAATVPPCSPAATPRAVEPAVELVPTPSAQTMLDFQADVIRDTVAVCGGNISQASKRLGISRNTIYRKMRWGGHVAPKV